MVEPSPRPRRRRRFWLVGLLLLLATAGGMTLAGGPIAWPFDVCLNLGGVVEHPTLRASGPGPRVVVLQHGLFRTRASVGRLARALAAHGYEVLDPGYPSTLDFVAGHAERLRTAIAVRQAQGPVAAWAFVGHSLGGLVIQEYLRQPGAVEPWACVYVATPHRGAVLCDLRKHWFLFRWLMGSKAAMELSPAAELHQRPIPWPTRSGTVVGDLGAGNAAIPGDDDGTVGVAEATFAGCAASVRLPHGHTGVAAAPEALRQVLHFLRQGAFAEPRGKQ